MAPIHNRIQRIGQLSLVCRSSASGSPRSANTLPLPRMICALGLLAARSCHSQSYSPAARSSAAARSTRIGARGSNSARRLFLERMQHIDDLPKANRVDRPIGSPSGTDRLEHARAFTLPGLGVRVLAAELRQPQHVADFALDRRWKRQKILLRQSNPIERLLARPTVVASEYPRTGMTLQFRILFLLCSITSRALLQGLQVPPLDFETTLLWPERTVLARFGFRPIVRANFRILRNGLDGWDAPGHDQVGV